MYRGDAYTFTFTVADTSGIVDLGTINCHE